MRVTAEVELGLEIRRRFICFRRMSQKDDKLVFRDVAEGLPGIVHLVVMGIINSHYPDARTVFADIPGIVYEHNNAGFLKIRAHFNAVVIAQDTQNTVTWLDRLQQFFQMSQTRRHGTVRFHADITADQTEVHFEAADTVDYLVSLFFQAVQMVVGQQQNAESIKGLRQGRKPESLFNDLNVQGLLHSFFVLTGQLENPGV